MGLGRKKKQDTPEVPPAPKLVHRRENRKSTLQAGRTIGERREKLETALERAAARDKIKKKQHRRIFWTVFGFIAAAAVVIFVGTKLFPVSDEEIAPPNEITVVVPYAPTVEVIDEEASSTGGHLTSRMKEYIGQAEADFRELGYTPTKVVIPAGSIREVDFYLDGYTGAVKLLIDRGTGVSVEDADRMIRYLAGIGVEVNEIRPRNAAAD